MMNDNLSMLMQMINCNNNPNMIIEQMIRQNPYIQNVFLQVKNSGLSSKDYVMQYAKQNNIDITPMINILNQRKF